MPGVKPSGTSRGHAWLSNFLPEDQPTALALLDAVKFVQLSTIFRTLRIFLKELVVNQEILEPALLLPVLSLEDLPKAELHVAYGTYNPGDPISATPGSEGLMGNMIRDLIREPRTVAKPSWLPPNTSIEELRLQRCRSIVIVTDYSGSGVQLWNYAKTLVRNSTIRSWRSGGFLSIYAVSFAASPRAFKIFQRPHTPVDKLWAVEAAPTFWEQSWTKSERISIDDLCHRYALRRHKKEALGFKSSRGLFATESGAPNNLPYILRQHGGNWRPFFEGRTVPPELVGELGDYAPDFDVDRFIASTGQIRIASMPKSRNTRRVSTELLQVLSILARRPRPAAEIAATTGFALHQVETLLATLASLGLIEENHRLSARGTAELAAGKRAVREVAVKLSPSDDPYYPSSMR
jgi:hypothetical protein